MAVGSPLQPRHITRSRACDLCSTSDGSQELSERESTRISAIDTVAREYCRPNPGQVTLIDLGQRLSPGGRYTQSIDGVVIRAADRVHISEPGGEWLTPWLVPLLKSAIHRRVSVRHEGGTGPYRPALSFPGVAARPWPGGSVALAAISFRSPAQRLLWRPHAAPGPSPLRIIVSGIDP